MGSGDSGRRTPNARARLEAVVDGLCGSVLNERRDAEITPERRARLEAMHLTRLGQADDVAYACVYLASRESEFLTGVNLPLDGGGSAARGAVLG